MDRSQGDIINMDKEFMKDMAQFQQEQMEFEEDKAQNTTEDDYLNRMQLAEGYPAPEPDEKMNPHTFLHKAAFGTVDTTRTTFLSESELGRPLFSVRFMLKMEDVAKYYLDDICTNLDIQNKIANYFNADIQNTTDSGMSNKGFAMNLNVTRRMDTLRRKARISNLKGGETEKNET